MTFVFIYAEIYFPNEANQVPNYGRCITPNRERALCIHLEDCKYLYGILTTSPLKEADKLYLSRSQCGYVNRKVLVSPVKSLSNIDNHIKVFVVLDLLSRSL